MNHKFTLGLAAAAVLFAGCGDESVNRSYDEAKSNGNITLKIVDSNTGVAIDSASVYSLINKDSSYTDSVGVSLWKKNAIGQYEYTIAKDGYATRTVIVSLNEDGEGDIARVEDKFEVVPMYKLGVSVKGTVLLKDPENGNLSAAKNVPVVLTYTNSFIVPQEVVTETNSSGVYEFEDLAEGLTYSVSVPQVTVEKNTYAYDSKKNIGEALREGEQRTLDQITMEIVGLVPEVINSNLLSVDVKEDLSLTFSTSLIIDSVPNAWKVVKGSVDSLDGYACSDGKSVLTSATLDKDGKTVIVHPISEGWTKLASYCVTGTVYTKEGKSKEITARFVPGSSVGKPNLITGLTASWYGNSYVRLQWTPTADEIRGYKVYYKTNLGADYEELYLSSSDSLPVDSAKCTRVSSYTAKACSTTVKNNSTEDKKLSVDDYDNRDSHYYWYTKFNYFWSKEVSANSSDVESYSKTMFVWNSKKDSVTCNVPYDEDYDDYCNAELGDYDDYHYDFEKYEYQYVWYTTSKLAKNDTCVTSSYDYASYTSYTSCDQYDEYKTSPIDEDGETVYLKAVIDSTTKCTLPRDSSYSSCSAYKKLHEGPFKTVVVDSVAATIKGGDSYSSSENYKEYETKYGDYDREDYSYYWYTDYRHIQPHDDDKDAFISKSSVFTSDKITKVSFIVLPYVKVLDEEVSADPIKATPASIEAIATKK